MAQIILNQGEQNLKKDRLESVVIDYIETIIKFDITIGRDKNNFFLEDYNNVTSNIEFFRKQGIRIFLGGGNIFFMRTEQKIDGLMITCIHVRGMARRLIKFKE